MGEPTKIRATIREGVGELRMLVSHDMESGLRKDTEGRTIPAHFVQTLTVSLNDRVVIEAQLGPAISRNPLFCFRLPNARPGDRVSVRWTDNLGDQRADEATFS